MNENLDLTKILKYCPKGWTFYSPAWGDLEFIEYDGCGNFIFNPIDVGNIDVIDLNSSGTYCCFGECIIFPSKEQRDWSKFTAPWYKIEKFDPKTLKPFDKVLVRDDIVHLWRCNYFSYVDDTHTGPYKYCASLYYKFCIPYNDDTKHLVGTSDEAPEYYRYWED